MKSLDIKYILKTVALFGMASNCRKLLALQGYFKSKFTAILGVADAASVMLVWKSSAAAARGQSFVKTDPSFSVFARKKSWVFRANNF
jgi:hypothetical protein